MILESFNNCKLSLSIYNIFNKLMSYVLDIENPRVQYSLRLLGIEQEELIKKTLSDFASKDVQEHIQQLRYSYHTRKQNDLVQQVKSYIKEVILKDLGGSPKRSFKKIPIKTSATPDPSETLSRIKEKHNKKIEMTIKSIKESFQDFQALEQKLNEGVSLRERFKSTVQSKCLKFDDFKEKQKENLKNIVKSQKEKWKNKRKLTYDTPRMSVYKKVPSNISLSVRSSQSDDDIQVSLQKYNEKMDRSWVQYQQNIDVKRQAAYKLSQKAENTCKAVKDGKEKGNDDTFFKMIMKQKAAGEKRKAKLEEKVKILEKNKQISLEKHVKASKRAQDYEKLQKKRANAIETRFEVYNKILEQKHTNRAKQLEFRQEFQRLKEEEILSNAERKRRIQ